MVTYRYRRGDTVFEWDTGKDRANQEKHGLSFRTAARVFEDVNRIEFLDTGHSSMEERFVTIGMVHDVLFVVYTSRGVNTRLISARTATTAERRMYYDSDFYLG